MADWSIKQGDARPIYVRLSVDLTGCTVQFRMWPAGEDPSTVTPTVDAAAALDTDGSPAEGDATFRFSSSDTATAGEYEADWRVTKGGVISTYPDSNYDRVVVVATHNS